MLSSEQMTVLFFAMGGYIFFLTKEGLAGSELREILKEGGVVKVQLM